MARARVSHVGSFPFKPHPDSIDLVIHGYLSAGVDAPSYPQLRDFVETFLEPLVKEGLLDYTGGMYRFKDANLVENARWLRAEPWESKLFNEKAKGVFRYTRAPITGAFTLASNIIINFSSESYAATALANKRIVEVLMDYVRNTIKYFENLGYNIVFIDEPVLSVIVGGKRILLGYTREDIINYLNYVFSGVKVERGLHVCGRISRLLFETLTSIENLDVVNFEFHGSRDNLKVINRELLESYSKKLSPGIASSKNLTVENLEELVAILKEIVNRAGYENVDLISADDGFGGLRKTLPEEALIDVCFGKLRRIREAVEAVFGG